MIAVRDFRYHDFALGKSVEIRAGQELDPGLLARNNMDVEKLARTKFIDAGDGATDPRPRKSRQRAIRETITVASRKRSKK